MKSTRQKTLVWETPKLNPFKSVVAGCGLLLLLPAAQAQFTWPVYEPFSEYTTAYYLGGNDSSNYWNFGNGGASGVSTYQITNTAVMSFPALAADPNPVPMGVQEVPVNTTSADRGAVFTAQTGTFYTSFLLNYQDSGGAGYDRLAYNVVSGAPTAINGGSFTRSYLGLWLTPDYRIKVNKNLNGGAPFSTPTAVLATNVPHLIVMRYLKVAGGSDKVDLWIDPTPFGDDTRIPAPALSTTNGANVASFNGIVLNNRRNFASYTMNVFQVDEIRFASTWSGVTPLATPAPGPMFSVTGGGIGCPGDVFPITLSGSVATNDYWLYTNNVYAGVTMAGHADGSALNLGSFSSIATYSVLASNNVNGNLGWMSNSPTIYVRAPVNIVGQPSPVITATNNRAQFTVYCTGDELSYQWFRDGTALTNDSHITGATAGTLVVWPAGPGDIGSYSCVITNPCSVSPTTSASASLTLDAVHELVWAGNSFLNIWDVGNATYAYFTDTGLNPAVFNGGDDVTFNDSATTPDLVVLTNVLTPTRLTVDANRNYRFYASGTIAGTGTLVKNGAGLLVISNTAGAGVYQANTYTGGTAITNGAVLFYDWKSLGTGPITLAGGTLESFLKGNAGAGLTNDIFVTADSAWQSDQSGQQSASLFGALNGRPGTTLTITNSTTPTNSPNYVFLNSPFTNYSAIVLSDLMTNWGLAGQRLVLNNNTGAQIYNGPISEISAGVGGVMKQGKGAVYLNAANTYTVGTTNTAGLLAGSGSISSPLVVASGGTLGGGSAEAIGTFTVNSDINLNGNVFIRVDKSLTQSNDMIVATGAINNGGTGTITLTNLGVASIQPGDTFKIFSKPVINGAALTVNDGNVTGWVNKLAIDGSVQAVSAIPAYPTNISEAISGTALTITWPQTHLGWILQVNTNSVAAANQWYDISNTANVTSTIIPVSAANPAAFYRLRHP